MSKRKDVLGSFSEGMTSFFDYLSEGRAGGVVIPILFAIGFAVLLFCLLNSVYTPN